MEHWKIQLGGKTKQLIILCDEPADFEVVDVNDEVRIIKLTVHCDC